MPTVEEDALRDLVRAREDVGDHRFGRRRGTVLGGVLIKDIAWQWIFWINVPVGIAAMVLCMVKVRESRATAHNSTSSAVSSRSAPCSR